jgi:hypothetical protein
MASIHRKSLGYQHRNIIIHVLFGCETWTPTLRVGPRLRVSEDKVWRTIFGPAKEGRENYVVRSSIIFILHLLSLG